jgi:hypothetical protein
VPEWHCILPPRFPFSLTHSLTHSHTVNSSLASASPSHTPLSVVDAALGIATGACSVSRAVLLSPSGLMVQVSLVTKAMRSSCDEKRVHDRIPDYDDVDHCSHDCAHRYSKTCLVDILSPLVVCFMCFDRRIDWNRTFFQDALREFVVWASACQIEPHRTIHISLF